MAFGISFGKNKKKTDQTTTVDKTESRSEQGSSTSSGQKASESSSSSSSTGSQTTTGSSNQNTSGSQTGTGTQTQTQTSTQFGEDVLGGLESAIGQILGGLGGQQAQSAADAAALGGFDEEEFVSSGMAGAEGRMRTQLDEAIGGLFDSIGGTSASNSAAALLEQRLQSNAAAELSGIEAGLVSQAEEITRQNIGARAGLQAQNNDLLNGLLDALKGGRATTEGVAESTTTEQTQQQQTGSQQQQTNQQQQQQQQTQAFEAMLETILKQLTGTSRTQGTENIKGTTTEKGGGFGLSI